MNRLIAIAAVVSAISCARQSPVPRTETKSSVPVAPGVATATSEPLSRSSGALQGATAAGAAATDVAKLQAENGRLTAEVARLTTEIDRLTKELNGFVAATPASAQGVSKRPEALASLRAVRSVVAGGVGAVAFKTYQLEAKIKVDALPDTPDNVALREVSRIYTDASTLFTSAMTQSMEPGEVAYFKKAYSADTSIGTRFSSALAKVPAAGITRSPELTVQLAAIGAESALLLVLTDEADAITIKDTSNELRWDSRRRRHKSPGLKSISRICTA